MEIYATNQENQSKTHSTKPIPSERLRREASNREGRESQIWTDDSGLHEPAPFGWGCFTLLMVIAALLFFACRATYG